MVGSMAWAARGVNINVRFCGPRINRRVGFPVPRGPNDWCRSYWCNIAGGVLSLFIYSRFFFFLTARNAIAGWFGKSKKRANQIEWIAR